MNFPIIDVYNHPHYGDSVRYENYVELQEVAEKLEARVARLEEALAKANSKLVDINDALYGKGFEIAGWHLNGDLEHMDTWFEENDWEPVALEEK